MECVCYRFGVMNWLSITEFVYLYGGCMDIGMKLWQDRSDRVMK